MKDRIESAISKVIKDSRQTAEKEIRRERIENVLPIDDTIIDELILEISKRADMEQTDK